MKNTLKRLTALVLCMALLCGIVPTAFAVTLKITSQPKNASAYAGERAAASVTATGDGLTYQWYIAAEGSGKFSKSSITKATYGCIMSATSDGRQAYCVITDANGNSVKSNTVTLSLCTALAVTAQPKSVTVKEGAKATVTIAAAGDGLSYTWYYKNPGASKFSKTTAFTGKTYSVSMDDSRDGRQVYCVITDKYGSTVQTNTATLSMQHPVKITRQPQTAYAYEGETAKTAVKATGDGLTYQWYIASATGTQFSKSSVTASSYGVKMSAASDGRKAYCIVTDKWGNTAKTNTVTLNVAAPFSITKQPQSVTVRDGETAKVSFAAKGEGLSYTWYYKNSGASKFSKTTVFKGNSYSVEMSASRAGRQVYCEVKDITGKVIKTNTVTLDLMQPVRIVRQPEDAKAYDGQTVKTAVTVDQENVTYAWYLSPKGSTKFSKSSLTGSTYSCKMTSASDGRRVYCVITDAYGNQVTTNTVTLSMNTDLTIVKQPENVHLPLGETGVVTVEAYGEGLTYTWYYKNPDGSVFSKDDTVKGNTYSVRIDNNSDFRQVYCVIKDAKGNKIQSDTVTLTMAVGLVIIKDIEPVTVAEGEKASVTVKAQGEGVTYTWYFKNAGATKFSVSSTITGPTYSIVMDETRNGRQVYCVVQDKYGHSETSATIMLSMYSGFEITRQPTDAAVFAGETAKVSFETTGKDLTYTWYYRNSGASAFTKTTSFKGNTYSVEMNEERNGRQVYCVVTNASGETLTTQIVTLYMAEKNTKVPSGLKYEIKNGQVTITGYRGSAKELVIPSHIEGKPVTAIGAEAFAGEGLVLTKVTLPYTLISIGDSAFSFSKLASITLPPSLTTIGDEAFNNTQLTSITIPNSVTNMDVQAFIGCKKLTSVTLPAGLKLIPEGTFQNCTALKTVNFCGSVTSIGEWAFSGCSALSSITLPEGMTSINLCAFENCTALKTVKFPSTLTRIGDSVFKGCTALCSMTIPDHVIDLGSGVFANCSVLERVSLPRNLRYIGNSAFDYCTSLKSIDIPDGVTYIGNYAFEGCTALSSVKLPAGLTKLGYWAFGSCKSLQEVIIPKGITRIESGLFEYCDALERVVIPDGVTSIGRQAFEGCRKLYDVKIPYGVTTIEEYAFRSCDALPAVDIPDSVTTIGDWAFSGCIGATSLHISKGLKKIGEYTFSDLWEVSSITIPSGVTSIADNAFIQCLGLQNLTIPGTVKTIGNNAFQHCFRLMKVSIPGSVTTIGDYAFNDCWDLAEISVPASVTSIGTDAFDVTNVLHAVRVPKDSYAHRWFKAHGFDGKFAAACTITKQPADAFAPIGEKAAVTIGVEGDVASYTWYYKDVNASSFSKTTSFQGKTYSIEMSEARAGRQVYCVLTDADGFTVRSDVATLYCAVNGLTYEEINNYGHYICITGYVGSGGALTIPDTIQGLPVQQIANNAFENCTTLTSVVVPSSVIDIGDGAFAGCTSLKKVTLPEGLINLGSAFRGCTALTTINLPSTLMGYSSSTFMDCTSLTAITVPGSMLGIFSNYFYNCYSLKTVNILSGVTSIDYNAFRGCTAITSLTIPGTVTTIGDYAFACLQSLETLTLPGGVQSIGAWAFADNTALTTITIPASVTFIGEHAFLNCPKLTVKCTKNSTAHTYCVENNIPFKLI